MFSVSKTIISVETCLNEAISLHKKKLDYNKKLNELEEHIKLLGNSLSTNSQNIKFSEQDKTNIKKISSLITKLQNITNSKLDFFESLSNHLSENNNRKDKYS